MRYLAYLITILLLQSCNCLWKCNPTYPTEDPDQCTKLKKNSKYLSCKCVAEEVRNVKGINPDEFRTEFCDVNADWLEVATLSKNQVGGLPVSVEIGVAVKPSDFTDKLVKYSDWDAAKDNRSHNIMLVMKHYFCTKGSWYSEKTAADNFLYDFNFKERKITQTFSPVPEKEVVYSQLVANCKKGSETYFHIHFDVFSKPVIKISKPAHVDLSSLPKQTENCQAKEAIEIAKVRPGEHYIYSNSQTSTRLTELVDILIGIELPGIIAHEHEFPSTDSKIVEILDKMKDAIKTDPNHLWQHDFKWILADKNSYHQIRVEIPPAGKVILYQTVAYCHNFTLRTSRVIQSKVDKDGNCIDGYLPKIVGYKQSITDDNIIEKCSPIYKKMPEFGNCVANDYYIEIKHFKLGPCEDEDDLDCVKLEYERLSGMTWLHRPELVDYDEEFHLNVEKKFREAIRSIGESERTREDWSIHGGHMFYARELLKHGRTEQISFEISRERDSKLDKIRLYQLVVNCGQFIYYLDDENYRITNINDGSCIDGSVGWDCDELDSSWLIEMNSLAIVTSVKVVFTMLHLDSLAIVLLHFLNI